MKTWSTAEIDRTLHNIRTGDHEPDLECFRMGDINTRKSNLAFDYTQEEIQELIKCAADVKYFADKYAHAMTDDGVRKITLRPYQRTMLNTFQENRNTILLASRQIGKTVTSAIFLAWYAIFHSDRNILVVANRLSTTIEIIDKIKQVIKHLPFFMQPGVIADGKTGMHFDNNCRLFSQATTSTAALGFAIHLLYADEFAHIHNNLVRPFYRSIYPTLSSSKISKIIISSTPNGKNLFYELWSGAKAGKNDYSPIQVDWWDVPDRDEAWKVREIANLGSIELFNQEYGNQFFEGNKMLLDGFLNDYLERTSHKFIYKDIWDFHGFDFDYEDFVWHKDFSPDRIDKDDKFVLTMDISDGIGQDYTVMNLFKIEIHSRAQVKRKRRFWDEGDFFRLKQIARYSSNTKSPGEIAEILQHTLFDLFDDEHLTVVIEANFKAGVVIEILSRHKKFYPDILVHTLHSQDAKFPRPGVRIQQKNRDTYIRELKTMLHEKRVVLQDKDSYVELSNFGLNKRGKFEAQTGHDDIAMTFVLLVPYFQSEQFTAAIEDLYDVQENNIRSLIDKRLTEIDEDDEMDKSLSIAKMLNSF